MLRPIETLRLFAVIGLAMGTLVTVGCKEKPKYPACETDDDCKEDGKGQPIDKYCVNKQCQMCRDDSHCDEGQECKSGRCEVKSECPCQAPQRCENRKCVDPECVEDTDCAAGKVCTNYICEDAGCTSDAQCGGGMTCVDGECQAAADPISAQCRPMDAASGDMVALQVVNFEFDKFDLTVETQNALEQNAECLKQAPDLQVILEGHCDERGTEEYNLGLGDKRARAVRDYLSNLGIDTSRFRVVSKGRNEPVCHQATESCFNQNRRVEFIQSR